MISEKMNCITRRRFLCYTAAMLAYPSVSYAFQFFGGTEKSKQADSIRGAVFKGDAPKEPWKWSHEGFLYEKFSDNRAVCGICPNTCMLSAGDRGVCRSRVNISGKIYSLAYGNPCTVNVDPIEKKPLFHFIPRSKAFSLATAGCNFRCLNCQNWEISQAKPEEVRNMEMFPGEVIQKAKETGSQSIAYTYSEATTFFEYMNDIARLAKQNGLHSLYISNGYINTAPLLELCKSLSGANINLKSYDDDIYRKLNGGRLQPVLDTLLTLHRQGVHLEITNLVVPEYTDDSEMVKRMCGWILENLGPDHPLHFLRFHPQYKLDRLPPTPVSTLTQFRDIAMKAGIHYVYVGNVADHEGNNTYCHTCKKLLILRNGYLIPEYHLENDRCVFCKTLIPGVWGNSAGKTT